MSITAPKFQTVYILQPSFVIKNNLLYYLCFKLLYIHYSNATCMYVPAYLILKAQNSAGVIFVIVSVISA